MGREHNTAWVCEEVGSTPDSDTPGHDPFIAPARFAAHVEAPDGTADEWLEWAELGDAVEWARARAARVIVRTCCTLAGRHYTAGEIPIRWERPDPRRGEMHDYPAEGLDLKPRRLGGYEFLDRAADAEEIPWIVGVSANLDGVIRGFKDAFNTALGAHDIASLSYERDSLHSVSFEVVMPVRAATHAEASRAAWLRCAPAVERALHDISADPNVEVDIDVAAYPESSPLAQRLLARED